MILTEQVVLTLAAICAPSVAASTLTAIAGVESGFDPLAIGVNGPRPQRLHPKSLGEAEALADRLITSGANVDLGLGQINVRNLPNLRLTIRAAFDPCHNLRASGQVLQDAYRSQAPIPGAEQPALRRALSIYNTGHPDRGFQNGYVARVSAAAGAPLPKPSAIAVDRSASPPAWDVFGQPASVRIVFTTTSIGDGP